MAEIDRAAVARAASLFRLAVPPTAVAGPPGEELGAAAGSSLEFQDYRPYEPGDDLRHVDWSAYARTDTLMVRLYREEVAPCVEVILDTSRSMATDPQKAIAAGNLAAFFLALGRARRAGTVLWLAGEALERHSEETNSRLDEVTFEAAADLPSLIAACRPVWTNRSIRIVISDFLFPGAIVSGLTTLAKGSARLALVQLLTESEQEPPVGRAFRLIDVETGDARDMVLTADAVAEYRTRLARLKSTVAMTARRVHGLYTCLSPALPLPELIRTGLAPAGLVEAI